MDGAEATRESAQTSERLDMGNAYLMRSECCLGVPREVKSESSGLSIGGASSAGHVPRASEP